MYKILAYMTELLVLELYNWTTTDTDIDTGTDLQSQTPANLDMFSHHIAT